MKIGIPREIKNNEFRIGITPKIVENLILEKHEIFIETKAGEGSGFLDEQYIKAGAKICDVDFVWQQPFIIKIKEPLSSEYKYFKKNQIIFTYFHLAANIKLGNALMKSKSIAVAYELVRIKNKTPLLAPMSKVAGKLAVLNASQFLQKQNKGYGVLPGGISTASHGKGLIIGGGVAGYTAAKISLLLGQNTVILDKNKELIENLKNNFKLKRICEITDSKLDILFSDEVTIKKHIKDADMVISTVHIPGQKATKIIKKEFVDLMKKGSVIIDVAIDQGGSIETIKEATTHDNPIKEYNGILQYAVANIPGAVPRTSSIALTNATEKYIFEIANKGLKQATLDNPELGLGICVINGKITNKLIAESFNYENFDYKKLI